jgi:hypothetical protein
MKRDRRCLLVPQWEFRFTPDTFNLMVETGIDGDRITRERAEAYEARRNTEAAQTGLFSVKLKAVIRQRGPQRAPKRAPNSLRTPDRANARQHSRSTVTTQNASSVVCAHD